eukprot:6195758-Pleurochrysis_carterae.AAC.2
MALGAQLELRYRDTRSSALLAAWTVAGVASDSSLASSGCTAARSRNSSAPPRLAYAAAARPAAGRADVRLISIMMPCKVK